MTALQGLIKELAAVGATLRPQGGQLLLRAGEQPVPAQLVRSLRKAKVDLLAILDEQRRVAWLDQNPCPSRPGVCVFCGAIEGPDAVVLPFGVEPGMHAWLHSECWQPWQEERRGKALSCLAGDMR
jgi:hypothetical protein